MTWRELPPPSVFERLAARGAEREFGTRVERAFSTEPAALARVRSAVLAQVPAAAPHVLPPRKVWARISWQRGASVALAVAVIAVAGLVMTGARSGGSTVAMGPVTAQPAQMAAILDRSAARLRNALGTIGTSDATTVALMLTALRADYANVEAALQRPGTDLTAAATSLRYQAGDLATMAALMPADNMALYQDVAGALDRIIATLPAPAGGPTNHPGAGGPPAGNGNGNGDPHGNPGNGNGNGGGNGNGNGNGGGNGNGNPNPGAGNGDPGANDKPHPTPRGNGNPGANGRPDAAGHSQAGGNDKSSATPSPKAK